MVIYFSERIKGENLWTSASFVHASYNDFIAINDIANSTCKIYYLQYKDSCIYIPYSLEITIMFNLCSIIVFSSSQKKKKKKFLYFLPHSNHVTYKNVLALYPFLLNLNLNKTH